jgi:hypothetical protein
MSPIISACVCPPSIFFKRELHTVHKDECLLWLHSFCLTLSLLLLDYIPTLAGQIASLTNPHWNRPETCIIE